MAYKDTAKKTAYQNEFIKSAYDRINLTVPKGRKAEIKAAADAHKHSPQDCGCQRKTRKIRPQGRKLLADPVDQGESAGGQGRVGNKGLAQGLPADPVADGIYNCGAEGRGDMKPVIQQ